MKPALSLVTDPPAPLDILRDALAERAAAMATVQRLDAIIDDARRALAKERGVAFIRRESVMAELRETEAA